MSVLVWAMLGIAVWHFAVLVPDKFTGGIIGAFLASLAGALAAGYLLPSPSDGRHARLTRRTRCVSIGREIVGKALQASACRVGEAVRILAARVDRTRRIRQE